MLKSLYDIGLNIIKNISSVWDFLNNPYTFDLPFFDSITFIPIDLIGIGILTLIFLWFVKELIPGA